MQWKVLAGLRFFLAWIVVCYHMNYRALRYATYRVVHLRPSDIKATPVLTLPERCDNPVMLFQGVGNGFGLL